MSAPESSTMLRISVVSGKGGVGKSTVTAAIASLMSKDNLSIVAVDCDVDAPNLSLLFGLKKNKMDVKPVYTTEKASFIEEKCVSCKKCVDEVYCTYDAISWDDEKNLPILDTLACEGCGACSVLCPSGAYDIGPIESGYIYSAITENGFPLVYGETIIGASTSGKTVTETRDFALDHFGEAEYMIIDGPPGIGCPVLAALTGTNFAIVVMEPFPAAFHDASRVIEVINNFGIPFGIVINRSDVWDDGYKKIKKFIEENNYIFLGDIPIDMNVPKSVVNMVSIIKYAPESPAAKALEKIYGNLKKIMKIK
ncbi:MAG: P-loop NTPase [Promethearchaeota archaeon]